MKVLLQTLTCLALMGLLSIFQAQADHLSGELMVSAKLGGDQEVPAVTTDALGVASFVLNATMDTMCVNVSVNGLSGPITGIHVHEGARGENGSVITNLTPFVDGNRIVATLTGADLTTEMIAKYLTGAYYLNVHTAANPNGEIRGQLVLEKDWAFRADLDTMQQNQPVVMANPTGVGVFNLSLDRKTLKVWVAIDDLSGDITASHFHGGAAGQNGGVVADLSSFISGNTIIGTLDASMFPGLVDSMLAGKIYLNVHTAANPSGELRGQVWLDNYLAFDARLTTGQEVTPPTGSTASGTAYFSLSPTMDTLWYKIQAEGLSGALTGAHIHQAGVGSDGGVVINFTDSIDGNQVSGYVTGAALTDEVLMEMLEGGTYINLHTALNAGGEIRGQIYRVAREGYAASLSGDQEVPAVAGSAVGGGLVSVSRDQTDAHVMIVLSGLSGPLTGAHFHNGLAGENGGVVYALTPWFSGTTTDDAAFGYWTGADATTPFTTSNSLQFRRDSIYINIHTAANPGGEIRGQVLRGACFVDGTTGIKDLLEVGLNVFPNPVSQFLNLTSEKPIQSIQLMDMRGVEVIRQNNLLTRQLEVNMNSLPAGVYLLRVEVDGQILNHKISRQ